jgi:hypothetical protein
MILFIDHKKYELILASDCIEKLNYLIIINFSIYKKLWVPI